MMKLMRRREKGFTLLEVMLVVIIIGIIAIIALPRLLVTKSRAEEESCDSNLQAIRTQLEQFQWREGHYPDGGSDTTIAFFIDSSEYPLYWPEDSTISAECPSSAAASNYPYAITTITTSNESVSMGSVICDYHTDN